MHLKQFFRWNKVYFEAVSVILVFYENDMSAETKNISFSLLQPGTLLHAVCQENGLAAGGIELAQAQQKGF